MLGPWSAPSPPSALAAVVLAGRRGRCSAASAADAPVRTGYAVPSQVDRADFARPEAPWLVAVFTSATCDSCAGVWERAQPLDERRGGRAGGRGGGPQRTLHDRYGIEAVPATLVVDADGVVAAQLPRPGDRHRPLGRGRRGPRARQHARRCDCHPP